MHGHARLSLKHTGLYRVLVPLIRTRSFGLPLLLHALGGWYFHRDVKQARHLDTYNCNNTFRLRINYGLKDVSDYLFRHVTGTLGCFINPAVENNTSQYDESYQCRMVAKTVLRTTFMGTKFIYKCVLAYGMAVCVHTAWLYARTSTLPWCMPSTA